MEHLQSVYGLVPALAIVHVVIPAIVLFILVILAMEALDRRRW